jgi:predicted metal-dependent peptidase
MRVLSQVPFFAPGVARLPVVWDESIDTACTAGDNIRFNPGFFDKLKEQEVVTVLCHEVAHCLLGHIWRAPVGCEWEIWNQATDHAVNNMLKEFAEQVTAKR